MFEFEVVLKYGCYRNVNKHVKIRRPMSEYVSCRMAVVLFVSRLGVDLLRTSEV